MTAEELSELQIGDMVAVKRNLDHPAFMKRVESEYDGTAYVRDASVVEDIGAMKVVERSHLPAHGRPGDWGHRPARTLVRLENNLWYDLATGLQDGSESTRIERMMTWADVKDDPGLQAISIRIHAVGAVVDKPWVKHVMDASHWDRIVTIAETTADELGKAPGFSWVVAAIVDDEAVALEPPEHLRDLVARDRGIAVTTVD